MGICSTTYGDLVCRGCRRFAHEIVDWNGYTEVQKASILERLKQIKHEVLSQYLIIEDKGKFEGFCRELDFGFVDLDERMYAVLAYLITKSERLKIGGLAVSDSLEGCSGASELMRFLESEMYTRAQAHYERNFKIQI